MNVDVLSGKQKGMYMCVCVCACVCVVCLPFLPNESWMVKPAICAINIYFF